MRQRREPVARRATTRSREIAIRAAIGAGPAAASWRAAHGERAARTDRGTHGIGIAYWLLDIIIASIPEGDLPYYYVFKINGRAGLHRGHRDRNRAGVRARAGATSGGGNLQTALKIRRARSDSGSGRNRMRTALAIGEIALSMVLLVGAALFVRSFVNLKSKTGGIESAN